MTLSNELEIFLAILMILISVLVCILKKEQLIAISLWALGGVIGIAFLNLGNEYLAFCAWTISCLLSFFLIFYSSLFGETQDQKADKRTFLTIASVFPVAYLFYEAFEIPNEFDHKSFAFSLKEIGASLVSDHWVEVELIGLTLLFVVIAMGIIGNPMERD
ncbi:MAG: hypothetical protein CL678_09905 [Bdellovibrionaceae bacterium]|nr:hypothetical protein [Pseudobdellovibrionaceae bacterium]